MTPFVVHTPSGTDWLIEDADDECDALEQYYGLTWDGSLDLDSVEAHCWVEAKPSQEDIDYHLEQGSVS